MKFNLKWISVLLILFFISLSAVSAQDTAQLNDTVSEIADADEITSINEIGESTLTDANNYYALQRAIWNAQAGDTITLTDDYTYDGNDRNYISVDRTLTIDGNGHTLDGQNAAYISIGDANVVIKNVKFINNKRDWGAIVNYGDSLTLDNCTFMNNRAGSGGVVYLSGTNSVTITNCRFESNVADYGGAIRMNGGSATITNNKFVKNEANNAGGAIYVEEGSVTLTGNYFTQSTAGSNGGAVYINGASATVTDNQFKNGNAGELAGALFLKSDNANVNGNEFSKNVAGTSGGAMYVQGENNKLADNTFTGNHATDLGGAIRLDGSENSAEITGNTFQSNYAKSGGAIYANGKKITISKNAFDNHEAKTGAGGTLNIYDTSATISDNNITNSNSKGSGGAIYIESKTVKLTNNYISQCVADDVGGAAYITKASTLNILNNRFINNTIGGEVGGALFIKTNKATIKNNEFAQNTAPSSGGAIRIEGDSHIISNNTFTENKGIATLGGAICSLGHNNQFTYNTFINNVAGRDGGAIFTEGTNIEDMGQNNTIAYNTFIGNQAIGNPEGCHGGAVSMAGEGCAINYNNFTDNHAYNIGGNTSIGGAIRWNGADSAMGDLIGNIFDGNDAQSGGSVYIKGHGINIADNVFNENEATDFVGGSINIAGNNAVISRNNFTNSKSKTGGSIYVNGKNTELTDNVFSKSNADGDAGAAYIIGESATVSGNKFTDNTAEGLAGAALIKSDNANINGNEFTGNTAKSNGAGAAYIEGTSVTLSQNTFDNNKAQGAGGSVNIHSASATIANNEISNSNSQTIGGGGIYANGENIQFQGNTIANCSSGNNGGGAYLEGSGTIANSRFTGCSATKNGGGIFANSNYNIEGTVFKDNTAANAVNYYPTSIPITKLSTRLTVTDASAAYGSDGYITATLKDTSGNPISDEGVVFDNNGVKETITTDMDGNAKYYTNELAPGSYSIKVTFNGNDAYNAASSVTSKVTISKADISITALYNDTNKEITATITDDATGNALADADVEFKINGVATTVKSDSEGKAIASTADLPSGTYTAEIAYAGNTLYNPANTSISFEAKADKVNTTITADDVTTTYNSGANITATLKDEQGNAVSDVELTFKIGSTTLTAITDADGTASVSVDNINPNTYTANIAFSGTGNYNDASTTAKVTIDKADAAFDAPDISVAVGDKNGEFAATLINNATGKAISGVTVAVTLNGVKSSIKTDENGQVKVSTADLALGNYTASISYAGNSKYNKASATANVEVRKTDVIISAVYDASNKKIVATLTNNATGAALVNLKVTFDINGVTSTAQTNSNGKATASTANVTTDTITAVISYAGNAKYNPASINMTFSTKINVDISAVYDAANTQIIATVTNNDTGKAIINVKVNFDINGETKTVKTNSKGQAKLSTKDLKTGTYTAEISYAGNSKYNPASTSITFATKIDSAINAVYDESNSEIVATVINNATGNGLSNANVQVTFNGETKTVKTNSKGQVKVSTTGLALGTYPATFTYAGNSKYTSASTSINVEIKTKVIVTDVYAYEDRIVAKLTNGATGKYIANANMIVEINGVKYNVKSDNKGQLTFNTTGLGLPDAYDLTISYRGNDRYTASSATVAVDLNKANMMITTNYHANKQKMVATLKNSKTGVVVRNANMIIDLNGVKTTYKSNDQGKITLPTADFAPGIYV